VKSTVRIRSCYPVRFLMCDHVMILILETDVTSIVSTDSHRQSIWMCRSDTTKARGIVNSGSGAASPVSTRAVYASVQCYNG
jgi:hypothetical protein